MKKYVLKFSKIMVVLFAISSCTVEKRHYRNGFFVQKKTAHQNINSRNQSYVSVLDTAEIISKQESIVASIEESVIPIQKTDRAVKKIANLFINNDDKCDEIIFRDGKIINGKIIEIGVDEIKYKRCDNLDGPSISIYKKEVFMIKYSNGTKEVFKEEENTSNEDRAQKSKAKNNALATTSMILGILSLISWYFSFIMGLLAIIFGAIALRKIKSNPNEYKNKGMAKAGLILGIVSIGLWIIILAVLL